MCVQLVIYKELCIVREVFIIKKKSLEYISIFLYLIGASVFQRGEGFDAIFVRLVFALMMVTCLVCEKRIIITEHLKWCIVFWGLYYLSMLWASNPIDTLYYINRTIQIVGISICFSLVIQDKKDIDVIIKMIVISLLLTSVRVIILTPSSAWGKERVGEAIGLYSNDLGMRLAVGALMCLYIIHSNKEQRKLRIIYILILVLFAGIGLLTGSKKSLLIMMGSLSIYELVVAKGWRVFGKLLLIISIGIGLVYLIFNNDKLYYILGRRIEKTFLTIMGQASGYLIDGSLIERRYYRDSAVSLFLKNPIIGYGGNNFVTYMREQGYAHVAYCHNNFLEILSTLGIVGFVVYYYEWAKTIIVALKRWKKRSNSLVLFTILIFGIVLMDYGTVSYVIEFTQMILILSIINLRVNMEMM